MNQSLILLKQKEFWSKKFKVNKGTLIPRPETELMIEKLLKIYKKNKKSIFILDIGTGSGCILLSFLVNSRNLGSRGRYFKKSFNQLQKKMQKNIKLLKILSFIINLLMKFLI